MTENKIFLVSCDVYPRENAHHERRCFYLYGPPHEIYTAFRIYLRKQCLGFSPTTYNVIEIPSQVMPQNHKYIDAFGSIRTWNTSQGE